MILKEKDLRSLTYSANLLSEGHLRNRCFSEKRSTSSVFLSHQHEDIDNLKRVVYILKSLHADIYVDWLDSSMPKITSGDTGSKIKQTIKQYDKFILVASNRAIDSKWCNWELGYGDAQKYEKGKIALFPIAQNDGSWKGSEYMQIYPTIQYYDGKTCFSNKPPIPKGFYYKYLNSEGEFHLINLYDWLKS